MENRKLTRYKIPGGKRIALIDKEAVLAFDEYYPEWSKRFYTVPPQLTGRDTLFGEDRGYDGEFKIVNAFKGSKINGILIANFSNKDQNNALQSKSELTFECDFILLTKDYGLWSIEVGDSFRPRIKRTIREKFEQLMKNRNHMLKLAKELYGENFSSNLSGLYSGIVAVPNATSDDIVQFKTTTLWRKFVTGDSFFKVEFIGEENISDPLSIAECIRSKQLFISSPNLNCLRQFYATITLVKTSYKTLDLEDVLSKNEKKEISDSAAGMNVNEYHIILSPEQTAIINELPTHLQIIGEAATGKTELLKAVAHIIFKHNSGRLNPSGFRYDSARLHPCTPKISSFAEGVSRIMYVIFGDRPYLRKSIYDYFSLLMKNLQPFQGNQIVAEVHSIAGSSPEEIYYGVLKLSKAVTKPERVFILVDESYHNIDNLDVLKFLFSCKGCWIATVLTGQRPLFGLQVTSDRYAFITRALRRVYRGTRGITVASSTLKLSSTRDAPAYLANRFSYVRSHNDIEIKDIKHAADLLQNADGSLYVVLTGKDRSKTSKTVSVTGEKKNKIFQRLDSRQESCYEVMSLQKETENDNIVYLARYSGAEWNSVTIVLDISVDEFKTKSDIIYLLLSLCTSRALCGCLVLCHKDFRETLKKRFSPNTVIEAVRCDNSQNLREFEKDDLMQQFLSIFSHVTPLSVAAGAYNMDAIEMFLTESNQVLPISEAEQILFSLTEPFPDDRVVNITKIVLERSRDLCRGKGIINLKRLCYLQSENECHVKILTLLTNYLKSDCFILGKALIAAAANNHHECTKYLLQANTYVNAQSEAHSFIQSTRSRALSNAHDAALMMATRKGHLQILKCLMKAKANVGMQDGRFNAVLTLAEQNRHLHIVKYLIEAKAHNDITISNDRTLETSIYDICLCNSMHFGREEIPLYCNSYISQFRVDQTRGRTFGASSENIC